ncbi:hypothetical protein [Thalassiella azotivora]
MDASTGAADAARSVAATWAEGDARIAVRTDPAWDGVRHLRA